jgi:uncharacterized protein YukE
MTMPLKVDLEQLVGSANKVTGQGEELATSHIAADGRIAEAEAGWRGQSAAALYARAAVWNERSARLVARLGDHATGMHNSVCYFAENEAHTRQTMAAVYPADL